MKRKIADTVLLTLAGSIPLASWLIRNILTAETATDRTLAIHVVGVDHANQMIATLQNFLLPIPVPGWAQALFLGLVAALYLAHLSRFYTA